MARGQEIALAHPYKLTRSARARRVSVRIDPRLGLLVTAPKRLPKREVDRSLQRMSGWIDTHMASRQKQLASHDLAQQTTLEVLGEPLTLIPEPARTTAKRRGSELLVPDDLELRKAALVAWLRRQARQQYETRLAQAAEAIGRQPSKLRITDTRSRWGSCSSRGTISLSWRLVLAPPDVMDYVIWHEACHLIEQNHGPRFWSLLASHRPNWPQESDWLKRNGADLQMKLIA